MKSPLQTTADSELSRLLDWFPELLLIAVGVVLTNLAIETS